MSLIQWRDEYRTGDAAVDEEHRELIELINELHERLTAKKRGRSREHVVEFLGEIYARIASHFALEERKMRDTGYGEYEAHKSEHERLLDAIRDIMTDYDEGLYEEFEQTLSEHLDHWFSEHFRTFDARLHSVLGH